MLYSLARKFAFRKYVIAKRCSGRY